jgi:endonuclease/exonuclease/phosphatase family metal-dependent hydrolase
MNTNAQNFVVGTYNLRYENNFDTGNLWVDRAPVIEALIRFHDFDILGTQEGLIGMLNDLSKALPEYQRYGIGRDDGKDAGEHSAIFFKKDKFSLLKHGDFWLSQTPEKPSLGWDATCCNRICSWVYLQDKKSKKKFYVFNAHYDYQKDLARNESSKLILKEIKRIAGNAPVIFVGDLNGSNETQWCKAIANSGLLKDTFKEAKYPYANNPSFQDFGKEIDRTDVIDHIFVTKDFLVKRWGILSDTYHGKYPSDHFPVLAEVVLK